MPTPAAPAATPGSLWWPGDHRAGDLMGDAAFLAAMVRAEAAWLAALVDQGVAPVEARPTVGLADLTGLVTPADLPALAEAAEAGGNPVIGLVALLRDRLADAGEDTAATWLHRGLTSQDVVDTAMLLCARDALDRVAEEVGAQVAALRDLVATHRAAPMVARTLTQTAVPTTFGAKAATWLHGVLDAADDLDALVLPVQLGGAAGTLSGLVELAGPDGPVAARACRAAYGPALGLAPSAPWHTRRAPVTRVGDAAVTACDAWGRIAHDVLTLGRPEVGELTEGSGGGSSTMPQKANPTLSVLVRRAALAAPPLAATLHAAAADQVDERAAGGWHAEWATLAVLLRRTVVAAAHTTTLLTGLRVDTARMAARLDAAHDEVRAEQRALAGLAGHDPSPAYDGLLDDLVDEVLARADAHLESIRPTEETP